jgi:hypothetical protein
MAWACSFPQQPIAPFRVPAAARHRSGTQPPQVSVRLAVASASLIRHSRFCFRLLFINNNGHTNAENGQRGTAFNHYGLFSRGFRVAAEVRFPAFRRSSALFMKSSRYCAN